MSNAPPTVSIGLPVYNGQNYLAEAIESILDQTYPHFEVIIGDNASSDATADICKHFSARDPRVRYVRHGTNYGAAYNYNFTFFASTGQYFKWCAHDDVLDPTYLNHCVDCLQRSPEAVGVYTQTRLVNQTLNLVEIDPLCLSQCGLHAHDRLDHFYKNLHYANPVFGVFRRDILQETRLIDSFPSSDIVLLAELLMLGPFQEVSIAVNTSQDDLESWFDTSKTSRKPFLSRRIRVAVELTKSILRLPISARDRILCFQVTLSDYWLPSVEDRLGFHTSIARSRFRSLTKRLLRFQQKT